MSCDVFYSYPQYPKWLDENKSGTEASLYERYRTQHKIIEDICVEFEKETDREAEDVKKLRFEKIVDLMQKVS